MHRISTLTLLLLIILFSSSCFKKWTCTCTTYKAYFDDNFIDSSFTPGTTYELQNSTIETIGFKKKAKSACDKLEQDGLNFAQEQKLNTNDVHCDLK